MPPIAKRFLQSGANIISVPWSQDALSAGGRTIKTAGLMRALFHPVRAPTIVRYVGNTLRRYVSIMTTRPGSFAGGCVTDAIVLLECWGIVLLYS